MVDTVRFSFQYDKLIYKKLRKREYSDQLCKHIKLDQGHGRLLILLSLPKYFQNNNLQTLKRKKIKECLAKLSDDLGLDFLNASVTRLDYGLNIITKNKVADYIPRFLKPNYLNLTNYGEHETKTYTNGKRAITFYNKMSKAIKDGDDIPPKFSDKSVLRIEYRLLKYPESYFRRALKNYNEESYLKINRKILGKDLFDQKFFYLMATSFMNEYHEVPIMNYKVPDPSELDMWKKLRKFMVQIALSDYGVDYFLELIKPAKNKEKPSNYNEMKSQIKKHAILETGYDELVDEVSFKLHEEYFKIINRSDLI